jgi:hypothetical protein
MEGIAGPTLMRVYNFWHSGGMNSRSTVATAAVNAALDRARYAENEVEYRQAVAHVLNAFENDPPAVFLAFSERARAVSKRFAVPSEPGRDIMGPLVRLWRPASDERQARRN